MYRLHSVNRHHQQIFCTSSKWNFLQNVCFGFLIFHNLTKWRYFVTYLSNDLRNYATKCKVLSTIMHHTAKCCQYQLTTFNKCSSFCLLGTRSVSDCYGLEGINVGQFSHITFLTFYNKSKIRPKTIMLDTGWVLSIGWCSLLLLLPFLYLPAAY